MSEAVATLWETRTSDPMNGESVDTSSRLDDEVGVIESSNERTWGTLVVFVPTPANGIDRTAPTKAALTAL